MHIQCVTGTSLRETWVSLFSKNSMTPCQLFLIMPSVLVFGNQNMDTLLG